MRVLTDEHVSPVVTNTLQSEGIDAVVATAEDRDRTDVLMIWLDVETRESTG